MQITTNIKASAEINDLIQLGWNLDENENYHIDITVDGNGETFFCYTNTKKQANGIWEGSDSEHTGDNEQTIKDLNQLQAEGKLWNIQEIID